MDQVEGKDNESGRQEQPEEQKEQDFGRWGTYGKDSFAGVAFNSFCASRVQQDDAPNAAGEKCN